jgi:hypothetical protein
MGSNEMARIVRTKFNNTDRKLNGADYVQNRTELLWWMIVQRSFFSANWQLGDVLNEYVLIKRIIESMDQLLAIRSQFSGCSD